MSNGNGALVFEVYRNGERIRTEELTQDVIKIGKLPSSHLRLEDPNVSRIHAVIERSKNGEVHIIDLGSSRGTMVNGERVDKSRLQDGDEILLGQTRILLRIPGAQPAVPTSGWEDATQIGVQAMGAGGAPHARAQAQAEGPAMSRVVNGVRTAGYDEEGNWHDGQGGWYDTEGNYYDGTGGWYDSDGNYFDGQGGWYDASGAYHRDEEDRVRDVEVYDETFSTRYDDSGRGVLEVAFLWNDHVLTVNQYNRRAEISVGEGPKNTLQMKHPSIPDARFPVVKGEMLNFTDRMGGMLYIEDKRYTLEEAIRGGVASQGSYGQGSYTVPLTPKTRARLDIGNNTVLVHHAEPSKGVPLGLLSFDLGLVANLAASALLHAIFLGVVFFVPPQADGFQLDNFDLNNRFVTQLVKPEEPEPEEEPDWLKNKGPDEEGAKAKGDEGKAGDKKSDQKDRKMAIKGPADNKEIQIQKDREIVNNSGALKILNSGSPLTSAFGNSNQTLGMAAITAMGDNNGERTGAAYGVGAFGQVGTGRGGGGVSERGIGGGNIGTAGRGGGGAGGGGYGRNEGRIEERATKVPTVIPGRPVVTGALDKEIIRRVIRKHRREIKYCYEQELIKNKNLAGKVVVSFTISSTGAVVAAVKQSSTLNNARVEGCITSKIRRWVFPEPNGGGIVRVSYPDRKSVV